MRFCSSSRNKGTYANDAKNVSKDLPILSCSYLQRQNTERKTCHFMCTIGRDGRDIKDTFDFELTKMVKKSLHTSLSTCQCSSEKKWRLNFCLYQRAQTHKERAMQNGIYCEHKVMVISGCDVLSILPI